MVAFGEDPPEEALHRALPARLLAAVGAINEALAIADARIEVLSGSHDPVRIGERKLWQRWKADLLEQSGAPLAEVKLARDAYQAIPPRNPALGPKLIDLSDYYTRSFYVGPNATSVLETFQPRHGIPYDVRGIIELNSGPLKDGTTIRDKRTTEVPDQVEGIAVGQETTALHFLLNAEWAEETEPIEIGKLVLHYEDGTTAERSLIMGVDVVGWWGGGNVAPLPDKKIGWRNPRPNPSTNLAELTWKNPHPEKTITSLDFISTLKRAGPFLVAITLE